MDCHPPTARLAGIAFLCLGTILSAPAGASPQNVRATMVGTVDVSDGPTCLAFAPGVDDRVYVGTKQGRVWVLVDGVLQPTPALDISSMVVTVGESGLIGMVFDPLFATNRQVYLAYNTGPLATGDSMISRFTMTPGSLDTIDPASETIIWGPFPQGSSAHKGGDLEFGPDGMLYHGVGDGGTSLFNGPEIAQDLASAKGKILRFDVRLPHPHVPADNPLVGVAGANPLIWALGFRNPYRIDVDTGTGDIYVGDVGEGAWEEVTRIPANTPLQNGGWPCVEGPDCLAHPACGCTDPGIIAPIAGLSHSAPDSFCAIIGGLVYRGSAIPSLQGQYLYADFCTGQIHGLMDPSGAATRNDLSGSLTNAGQPIGTISDFTRDGNGEAWFVEFGASRVWRIDPVPPFESYCQANVNSTGLPARLTAVGTPSVSAGDVTFVVENLPANQFGLLFAGEDRSFVPQFAGSEGNLCVHHPIYRWNASLSNAGPAGRVQFQTDFQTLPPGMMINAGGSWNFQFWTRDVNPQPTSNTSNGLTVSFVP